jgi:hypothetical protein
MVRRKCVAVTLGGAPPIFSHLGETGPLSQGIQACRKTLRIRHINGIEARKKRPRGFRW